MNSTARGKKVFREFEIPLAFGGGAISGEGKGYGFGTIGENEAIELLSFAYDQGLRVFDTAPIYGHGLSERRMAKAFKGRRNKFFFVSKSGVSWDENQKVIMTNDPSITRRMLEQSLKDLETDWIDLYMVHWPNPNTPIQEPMRVLSDAKKEGKIRFIGLCNTTPSDLTDAQQVDQIDVVQSQLNPFMKSVITEIFPLVKKEGIDFMSWGTLDKGVLTGRVHVDRKFDEFDARSWAPWWTKIDQKPKIRAVAALKGWIEEQGHSLVEFALGHNLAFPEVSTLLCGGRSRAQWQELLQALDHLPPPDILAEGSALIEKNLAIQVT